MDFCYKGESFELTFDIKDPNDEGRVPSDATFVVRHENAVVQSGNMAIEGSRASFRFNADLVGMHNIEISYTMGMDRWITPFLLDVRETH